MRKWYLTVGLVLLGALSFAAWTVGNGDTNIESAADDGSVLQVSADPRVPGDSEEDLPVAPPDVRPSVTGRYRVTISFNETVGQALFDEVSARIRDIDPDAGFIIGESFPPTVVADFVSETEDGCLALVQGLEEESYVTSVSCGPELEPGGPELEPVVNDLE